MWGAGLTNVDVLACCANAEVLSLSLNMISSLVPFRTCPCLRELYLRKNIVDDLAELGYLHSLQDLRILWLVSNPCADRDPDLYREVALRLLPNLERLDSTVVSPEEREKLQSVDPTPAAAEIIKRASSLSSSRDRHVGLTADIVGQSAVNVQGRAPRSSSSAADRDGATAGGPITGGQGSLERGGGR